MLKIRVTISNLSCTSAYLTSRNGTWITRIQATRSDELCNVQADVRKYRLRRQGLCTMLFWTSPRRLFLSTNESWQRVAYRGLQWKLINSAMMPSTYVTQPCTRYTYPEVIKYSRVPIPNLAWRKILLNLKRLRSIIEKWGYIEPAQH